MAKIEQFKELEKRKFAITAECGLKILVEFHGDYLKNMQIVNYGSYLLSINEYIPIQIEHLEDIRKCKISVTEITDTPFSLFGEKYNYKIDKKKAEIIWNKLSEADKRAAIAYIPVYEAKSIKVEKKYPKTYLSSECWKDAQ